MIATKQIKDMRALFDVFIFGSKPFLVSSCPKLSYICSLLNQTKTKLKTITDLYKNSLITVSRRSGYNRGGAAAASAAAVKVDVVVVVVVVVLMLE